MLFGFALLLDLDILQDGHLDVAVLPGLFLVGIGFPDDGADFAAERVFGEFEDAGALFDVEGLRDGFLHLGDAFEDAVHHVGAFDRVFAGLFGKDLRFEEDEVRGVVGQVVLEFAVAVFFREGVGVFAVGEQADAHVHALFEQHVDTA